MKYIQSSENLQRNLIFSISPNYKSQPRVYFSNIQRHSKNFVQIDFLLMDQLYNRDISLRRSFPNNPSPPFTALASRKERDDFSSLKHVLGREPHAASSLRVSYFSRAKLMLHAKLMHGSDKRRSHLVGKNLKLFL